MPNSLPNQDIGKRSDIFRARGGECERGSGAAASGPAPDRDRVSVDRLLIQAIRLRAELQKEWLAGDIDAAGRKIGHDLNNAIMAARCLREAAGGLPEESDVPSDLALRRDLQALLGRVAERLNEWRASRRSAFRENVPSTACVLHA